MAGRRLQSAKGADPSPSPLQGQRLVQPLQLMAGDGVERGHRPDALAQDRVEDALYLERYLVGSNIEHGRGPFGL